MSQRIPLGGLGELLPVHVTMGRLAATVRATATALAIVSAVLGAVAPVAVAWLVPALAILVGWTAAYTWVTWTRGVRPWATAIDLAVAGGLCLAMGKLLPVAALPQGTSWVAVVASMAIIWAQPAGPAWIWIPAAMMVVVCFLVGSRLAGSPDGGQQHSLTMATQVIAGAVVMGVAVRTGRAAAHIFAALQAAQTQAELVAARRDDELAQLRQLHNGPLTTLTMAIHAEGHQPSQLLQRRAAANLSELPKLAQHQSAPDMLARLDERLAQVVVWYEPVLTISASLETSQVPEERAAVFVDAVSEALENVVRHARTTHATVRLHDSDGQVVVTVTDHGRGFDPHAVPEHRFGVRELIVGQLSAMGGRAVIDSAPGQGTTITLEWPRG